jgi:hypothetical protein
MKREALAPVLLVLALLSMGRLARADDAKPVKVALGAPFGLSAGQMARVEPEGLEITLQSISDDSGCAGKKCSASLFKGSIFTRLGEKTYVPDTAAFFTPDSPYTFDFAGFTVELTLISRPAPKEPLIATFKVVKAPPKSETKK